MGVGKGEELVPRLWWVCGLLVVRFEASACNFSLPLSLFVSNGRMSTWRHLERESELLQISYISR